MLTSSSTTPLAQTPKFITPQARHGRAPEVRLCNCGTHAAAQTWLPMKSGRQCCGPMAQCLPRAQILADRATPRCTTRTAERRRLLRFFPAPNSVTRAKTYTVSGTQFNGLSQGAAYGDDFQDATNYPLVRIVNQATGHVVYCRTHNHSTMAIATGSKKVSTSFDVPANAETGPSQLFVVANGIPSSPFSIQVR